MQRNTFLKSHFPRYFLAAATLSFIPSAFAVSSSSQIIGVNSGLCVDVAAFSTKTGLALAQWQCNGGANQNFAFNSLGDGSYNISVKSNGLCLDAGSGSTTTGVPIVQNVCGSARGQKWSLSKNSDGSYLIKAYDGKGCFNIDGSSKINGGALITYWCGVVPNEMFRLSGLSSTTPAPAPAPIATPKPVPAATPMPAPVATPLPVPSANSGGYGTYGKLFAKNSLWNMYPVNPVLSSVGVPSDIYYPAIGEGAYSTGIFRAATNDPAAIIYPPTGSSTIGSPDDGAGLSSFTVPHWPATVVAASGTDGHADIVDESTGTIYSFWQLSHASGRWTAVLVSTSTINGAGFGDPAHYYQGARAAGVPTSAGIIRKSEYRDGDIMYRHVLTMSMAAKGLSARPTYVFPATSADGDAQYVNTGGVPEGALMMLPSNFDLSRLVNPENVKIARTLMNYGARVVDRNTGTPFVIYVENGTGYMPGGSGWNSAYENELVTIQNALRMVSSQSGFSDIDGARYNPASDGTGVNELSLRGPWSVTTSGNAGQFVSLDQSIHWGATGANSVIQQNTNGTGTGHVAWAPFVTGASYTFKVKAVNGAKLKLEVRNNSFGLLYSSGDLADGQSVTFAWPNGTYVIPVATSGTNTSSSSVSCTLIKN